MTLLKLLGLYVGSAYAYDVLWRPAQIARAARTAARRRGKPLLNVGSGTGGSSVRAFFFGETKWGNTNCDIAHQNACGPGQGCTAQSCHCDALALPFHDKEFGAVIASHVIEHVDDPHRALLELERVADEIFVITPLWWAPHTWLHPGHKWYRHEDGRFMRLRP